MNTSNNLQYTTSKVYTNDQGTYRIKVSIRLNDECRNGHQDFAITADIREKTSRGGFRDYMGGCCHDEVLEVFPELKQFVDLHLCDYMGAPTHAASNGYYIMNEEGAEAGGRYIRATEEEMVILTVADDEKHYCYLLEELKIPQRWAEEAKAAIIVLEELTGVNFVCDSVKQQYTPLTKAETAAIELKISTGYYTPEAIERRRFAKVTLAKAKRIQDIHDYYKENNRKQKAKRDVALYFAHTGVSEDSFIYYDHTNSVAFNWTRRDNPITQEQFDAIVAKSLDDSNEIKGLLPVGLTFKLNKA